MSLFNLHSTSYQRCKRIRSLMTSLRLYLSNSPLSSDPCQLKTTTAQSVDDVIDVTEADMSQGASAQAEPIQKTIRRGGVSAEAITEEEIGTYQKKVVPKGH